MTIEHNRGLVVGAVVSLMIVWLARLPVTFFGSVNLILTILLFGSVGIIGLDSLL